MIKHSPTPILALACCAGLLLAGCSSNDSGSTPTTHDMSAMSMPMSGAPSASGAIVINGNSFHVPASVSAGQPVTVRNDDDVAHTVTSDGGARFDVVIEAHQTATFTAPDKAGSYAFHCTYHPTMKGELVVK